MASNLAGLALAELFGIAVKSGKPIVTDLILDQISDYLAGRKARVVKEDAADGWSSTEIGDPKNDYAGDVVSKRIDNFFFLYGKALPGTATDFLRDVLSERNTPAIRERVDENTSPGLLADLVANAIYAECAALAGK